MYRLLFFVAPAALLFGQPAPTFQHDVLPLFRTKCTGCHSGKTPMGGLDLTNIAAIVSGGTSGPAVKPGDPAASLLWKQIESGKMPAGGGTLNEGQKTLVRTWIEKGQFVSRQEAAEGRRRSKITDEVRQSWPYRKPVKPLVPVVRAADRVRNPVDAFILQKLEQRGWSLSPDAERRALLRRVYFDVTGLPPTPEVVREFQADKDPKSYEKLVDRLLASPQYGERWARHWMDTVGYSDSSGDADDELRPESWRYRDYVIRSLNADKPYNRFLLEQFAGDQLVNYDPEGPAPKPEHHEPLIATGMLRLPPDLTDYDPINNMDDKVSDAIQASVETSVKAVLGLQIGCAKCHDHKFDPILQEDYYKLQALFQPAYDPGKWLASNVTRRPWPTRYILAADRPAREKFIDAVDKHYAAIFKERNDLRPVYDDFRRRWLDDQTRKLGESGNLARLQDLEITNDELEKLYPELGKRAEAYRERVRWFESVTPTRIWGLWDVSKTPSPTHILLRGDYRTPGEVVGPGVPVVLDDPASPFQVPDPKPEWTHTGRRLALAKWMTRPDHPLTARVLVNRVWQYHFGEGIVGTPDDFGSQGSAPTHPELLDWLAVGFVENGWSLKWLHRQILLSSTYRQSSAETPEKMAADPTDRLLWRFRPMRLDAEVIRDSMLQVSGKLDPEMFGRYVQLRKATDGQWIVDTSTGSPNRRSIYLQAKRTATLSFLVAFDAPTMDNRNMPQRFRSALPSQALALMNSPFMLATANDFAQRLRSESKGDIGAAIQRGFLLAFSRQPTNEESQALRAAVSRSSPDSQWRVLAQAILSSNEFLYTF